MREWDRPDPAVPPNMVREQFDRALATLLDPDVRFTIEDGLVCLAAAAQFKVEVWPILNPDERAYYQQKITAMRARLRR